MAYKEGVHQFGPPLDEIFAADCDFKQWLLTKRKFQREMLNYSVINAERASYYAPVFSSKIARTRKALINDLVKKYS